MSTPAHTWHFFRTGGLDQVALTTGADLLALEHLDQKLWVALACPVKGLELDEKTLALIDTDGDGRIRVPELLAAITWSAARLSDVGTLLAGTDGLPLAALNLNTPEGRAVHASAQQILANLGKKNATTITIAESADTAKIFAASPLNGDGVIPPEAAAEAATKQLITDMIASTGGTADRTGSLGVTAADIEKFFVALADYAAWATAGAAAAVLPLGEQTSAASAAIAAVRAKIDDFFARCRLAAFDARALAALNRSETEFLAIAAKELTRSAAEVAGFPLARIEAGGTLPLLDGVNPAWSAALATLHAAAVTPIFGAAKTTLTAAEWADLQTRFTAHDAWAAAKAGAPGEKKPLWETGVDELRRVLDINLLGAMLCSRAILPLMRAQAATPQRGHIVNVSSANGKEGKAGSAAYSASKAGLIGLTKAMAKEVAGDAILVNCITPGAVRTAFSNDVPAERLAQTVARTPLGRLLELEEIARMVAWLSSDDCSFSTGAAFDLSGGRSTY